MDPIFASVIIVVVLSIIAIVAITYRQKDIAALAIKAMTQRPSKDDKEPETDK